MRRPRQVALVAGAAAAFIALATVFLAGSQGEVGGGRYRDGRGRWGRVGPLVGGGYTFQLARAWNFPDDAGYALPDCFSDSSCLAICKVASACTWTCYSNDGGVTGSTAQGAGQTCDDTHFGVRAVTNIGPLAANSPHASIPVINSMFAGDYTVIGAGYASAYAANENFFQHQALSGGQLVGLKLVNNSGVLKCNMNEGATNPAPVALTQIRDGWSVMAARRSGMLDGGASRICRANGVSGNAVTTAAGTVGTGDNRTTYFGTDDTNQPIQGPIAWFAFYSEAKSDAWLEGVERAWGGGPAGLTFTGGGMVDSIDAGGFIDVLGAASPVISATRGLRVDRAWTNLWDGPSGVTNAVASWAVTGTPIVSNNVASGPFSRLKYDAGYSTIEDDNDAGFEGVAPSNGASTGGDGGYFTASCYLASGTATTAQLGITTDGTPAATYCPLTLSATFQRYDCPVTVTSATTVKGRLVVGLDAGDTGTIKVAQCQMVAKRAQEFPVLSATGGPDTHDLAMSGLPDHTSRGKVEIVFTPLLDPASGDYPGNVSEVLYLWDSGPDAGGHYTAIIYGYNTVGRVLAIMGAADGGEADLNIAGPISLTVGQRYVTSWEWAPSSPGPCTGVLRLDTCANKASCAAASSLGSVSGSCPAQSTVGHLGHRYDSSVASSVSIDAVRIYQ